MHSSGSIRISRRYSQIFQFRAPVENGSIATPLVYEPLDGWQLSILPQSIRVQGSLGARGDSSMQRRSGRNGSGAKPENLEAGALAFDRTESSALLQLRTCASATQVSFPAERTCRQHIFGVARCAGSPSDEAGAPTSAFRRVWFWAARQGHGLVLSSCCARRAQAQVQPLVCLDAANGVARTSKSPNKPPAGCAW